MSLGRGFSIPQDKGAIRNGDPCIPLTPEKPILKRSSHLPAELQPGSKNWQDLLGIYTGFLQDETRNGAQQNFTRPGFVGQNQGDFINRNVGPIEELRSFNQNNGNGGSYIKNYPPTGLLGHQNHGQHSNRDVALIENFGSFNQNARNVGSYIQHLGNDIPQKVNSLVELLGTENAVHKPSRIETANRSSVVAKAIPSPHSQVLTNRTGYKNTSSTFQQNHSPSVNQDVGGYSLQQIPMDGRLVNYRPNYNLNLPPPRTEAGASTSTVRLFQLGPVTPDQQNKSKNFQPTGAPHWLIDEIPIQENDDIENVLSQQPKIAEKQSNQLLQNIVDEYTAILKLPKAKSISDNGSHLVLSQPPEIVEKQSNQIMPNIVDKSTSTLELPKENNVSDDINHEGIDLSKTPQQKPPRRRKHRPKVVVEGKPKRTLKPTTKNNTPDGNPLGKRKYVRKKNIKTSTTPLAGAVNEVGVSNLNSAEKSCRRMLNFVLENGAEKQSRDGAIGNQEEINEKRKMPFTWNLDSHNAEGHMGFNAESTSSSVKELHQSVHSIEKRQTENIQSFVPSINHTPQQLSLPFPSSAPSTAKDHTLNVIARRLSMRNANINQRGSPSWYSQVDHHVGGVQQAQFAIQTHTNETKVDGRRQPMLQTGTQLLDDLVDIIDRRGSKREYSQTELTQPETSALMGSRILCQRVYETGYFASESNKLWQDGLETSKRKKVDDKFHVTSSSTPFNMTFEHCSRQVQGREINSVCANGSTLHLNGGLPYSNFEGKSTSGKPDNVANKIHHRYMNPGNIRHEFQQQLTTSQVHSCAEHMVQKVTCHTSKAQSSNSLAAIPWNQESSSQRGPKIIQGNEIINSSIHLSVKEQTARLKSFNQALNMEKVISKENKKVISKENKTRGYKGSLGDGRRLFSVDDIIDSLKSLNINSSRKEIVGEEQGALVPYKQDGAIVPYEEFDPIKKRRPRPKVDLDPETNRLWNLLMGKEGSESTETTDKTKEKWWEEERNVFRGRVDSFIARMHLVQGDRRFSKWKGSVVDSVVGVFLTQNVSDHLSSSAFMCLAAKFPLKSTIIRQSCYQNEVSPSIEEREVQVTCPDGTITYDHNTIRQPVDNHNSVTSNESCQHRAGNVMTGTRNFAMDKQNRRAEEDVISSQSSSESLVFQANEDIRSSSGSNSEAEDQISVCNLGKNRGPLNLFEQAETMAALQEYRRRVMGSSSANKELPRSENLLYNLQNQGLDGGSKAYASPITSNVLHHQRSIPPSTNSWLDMTTGLEEWESNFLASPGKESISSLASTDFESTKTTDVERSFITQQTGEGQHSTNCNRGSHKTIQQESNFLSDCTTPAEAFNEKPSDNFLHLKNKISKPDAAGQVNSSTKPTNWTGPTSSNARKTKVEKEKREACHWDELRKQAQLEVGKRERTEETMDSLDYEALRKADVREISETIKERGMNNMLAERIKDFLNRLVEDHGGLDLEWLRDVPPEKSKDYLLSIRGLGLKSVECVRLLTLHNLAFPVDTNVGRIAVRLGWVPLQSLPEELQLHLLELYPVLESIQKYLWPRLCKLDQKTLYELHYQMITFGKVFCTKKQPNCNACPMRGECRHFASAFASARLALPGLEEKSIVASTPQTTANENPGVTIKPMSLPPVGDNSDRETGLSICEPIIEEPTTPEPPMELSETDIEDAFYEDPDEIPTIKLNIEQFATNLQTFMQEQNMETKETNLSKALVALRPEFGSIPTPKLKSMSRLRTEHQVYELPDDHPLLKGMERREADDPSPYLLAIWTPGETADSIQPPESKCNHQELGGLCDKKMCFSCNSTREEETQTVRGTLLIPCRTAMRGSFPLNGTYFQVNEVFADHESSLIPISVLRNMLWSLPRRTVFFGTSVSTIFKGLTTEGIQYCFWRGFVCVRGFEQKTRAPRPLVARLHYPASRMAKKNEQK